MIKAGFSWKEKESQEFNLTKNKVSKVSFFEEETSDNIQEIMDNINTKYKNN